MVKHSPKIRASEDKTTTTTTTATTQSSGVAEAVTVEVHELHKVEGSAAGRTRQDRLHLQEHGFWLLGLEAG